MVANVDKSLLYGELQVIIASVQIGQICLYSSRHVVQITLWNTCKTYITFDLYHQRVKLVILNIRILKYSNSFGDSYSSLHGWL